MHLRVADWSCSFTMAEHDALSATLGPLLERNHELPVGGFGVMEDDKEERHELSHAAHTGFTTCRSKSDIKGKAIKTFQFPCRWQQQQQHRPSVLVGPVG